MIDILAIVGNSEPELGEQEAGLSLLIAEVEGRQVAVLLSQEFAQVLLDGLASIGGLEVVLLDALPDFLHCGLIESVSYLNL